MSDWAFVMLSALVYAAGLAVVRPYKRSLASAAADGRSTARKLIGAVFGQVIGTAVGCGGVFLVIRLFGGRWPTLMYEIAAFLFTGSILDECARALYCARRLRAAH